MILFKDAVSWLNQFDLSHMDAATRGFVAKFSEPQISDDEFDENKKAAIDQSGQSIDPLNRHEVMICLGDNYYARGKVTEALSIFDEEHTWYENQGQEHRAAVCAWLAGIAAWELKQNNYAFSQWKKAVKGFESSYNEAQHRREPVKVNWYQARIHQMKVELAKTVEEGKSWLNEFGVISIDPGLRRLIGQIGENQRRGRYGSVQETVDLLLNFRPDLGDPSILPEILLEAGLAVFQMQAFPLAEEYLCEAVALFHPGSHRQVVTRWMLGAVQWNIPESRGAAVMSWMKAIQGFESLCQAREKENDLFERNWYRSILAVIRDSAEEKFSGL